MRARAALLLHAVMGLCTGCAEMMADHDGRAFGDDLGSFAVHATLTENSCGAGALGAEPEWDFDVRLRRDATSLYWVTGAQMVQGDLDSEGAFTLDSESLHRIREASTRDPGCQVKRSDHAAGTLGAMDASGSGFSGTLRYTYTATEGSECSELIGVSGGFSALPCSIGYTMEGTLAVSPKPASSPP